jgi:hypothetical protein
MDRKVGLWIDHREAVIVIIDGKTEVIKQLTSEMEKHVRFSEGSSQGGPGEDVRDRQFDNHLNDYYDEVIRIIGKAESVQIFGPGEAKVELRTRLTKAGMKENSVETETMDKMTENQIAAKVRQHFAK